MEFTFDNDRPIYIQLVEQLEIYIISGKISPGQKLLSVREFSDRCKVNPNTMQKALNELEQEQLIYTERTNGKYVTNDTNLINKVKKEFAMKNVHKYVSNMEMLGFSKKEATIYLQELGGEN